MTRTYVYDSEDILEERLSTGATIRFVHGPDVDQPLAKVESGATSYYLADHLGSIVQTTDASATVTLARQYDPWGNLLQGSGNAGYAFTGREWDPETGLYYYRARYYDPKIGRFLSEDPLKVWATLGKAYQYADDNPVNLTDPLGLTPQGKGERGQAAKPEGTASPYKGMRPHPTDPSKVIWRDPHTGKDVIKPKPEGFQPWWDKKHPPRGGGRGGRGFAGGGGAAGVNWTCILFPELCEALWECISCTIDPDQEKCQDPNI
jgi:RHS repeat-associated protein